MPSRHTCAHAYTHTCTSLTFPNRYTLPGLLTGSSYASNQYMSMSPSLLMGDVDVDVDVDVVVVDAGGDDGVGFIAFTAVQSIPAPTEHGRDMISMTCTCNT